MTQTLTKDHGDATFEVEWDSKERPSMSGTVRCRRGGRLMWTHTITIFTDSNWLIPRVWWKVEDDGRLFLHTEGEHGRGATTHQRRRHEVSLRRFEGTERLEDPDYFRNR
jgi:hypothetical protein